MASAKGRYKKKSTALARRAKDCGCTITKCESLVKRVSARKHAVEAARRAREALETFNMSGDRDRKRRPKAKSSKKSGLSAAKCEALAKRLAARKHAAARRALEKREHASFMSSGDKSRKYKKKRHTKAKTRRGYARSRDASYRDPAVRDGYRDQPMRDAQRSWFEPRTPSGKPAPRHSKAGARGWYLAGREGRRKPHDSTYRGKRPPKSTAGHGSSRAPKQLSRDRDAQRSWPGNKAGHRKAAHKGWWRGHKMAGNGTIRHRPRSRDESGHHQGSYHLRDQERDWKGQPIRHKRAAKKGWRKGHHLKGRGVVRHY